MLEQGIKKIINNPQDLAEEMIAGFVEANKTLINYNSFAKSVIKNELKDKTIIIACGGCGCEPMMIGYIGEGMADAVCIGEMYAAPSAYSIYNLGKTLPNGQGLILVSQNFSGDFLNADMAKELLELEGYKVDTIFMNDNIGSEKKEFAGKRAGSVGLLFALKILGAASEKALGFKEIVKIGEKVKNNVFTIPVLLYAGVSPLSGKKLFSIDANRIEFGMGFNGEPGIKSTEVLAADEIVNTAYALLVEEMQLSEGQELCIIINTFGTTTYMEQCIVYKHLAELLNRDKIKIFDVKIGRYLTSQETGGFSITMLRLDEELKELYRYPAYSPAFSNFMELNHIRNR